MQSATVMPKGLQFDRRWMLVDSVGKFLTQRVHSKMALFKQSLSNGGVQVTFEDDTILIPNNTTTSNSFRAQIWDDIVTVSEVSDEHTRWFS